jgi:zinc and cadmium transporter
MDYLILLSSIVLGALSVFWFKLDEPWRIKLLNAFTGAYLLTLTFLHLLPELYQARPGSNDHLRIGALMLIGFFTQIALDAISKGIEHGHAHNFEGHLPIGVLIGLCLHAFIEAMALGDAHTHHDLESRRLLLWSIVLHNYPVSIALLGMLLHSGVKRNKALGLLAIFAAMAPLGMFVSAHTGLAAYSRELMAIVIGIFMHISTTILFESEEGHRIKLHKLSAIVVGVGLGILSVLVH